MTPNTLNSGRSFRVAVVTVSVIVVIIIIIVVFFLVFFFLFVFFLIWLLPEEEILNDWPFLLIWVSAFRINDGHG